MECLFKTYSKYTLEEFQKHNFVLSKQNFPILLKILLVILCVIGIIGLSSVPIIFVAFFSLFSYLTGRHETKKLYYSNKTIQQNPDSHFEFYGSHFTVERKNSSSQVEYTELHKIIETKTNFYLLVAKNSAYILIKENFPEGLEDFLRNKRDELNLK